MSVESRENDPELKDRVQRLLTFLSELVKARSAPVRVVDRHRAVMSLAEGNLDVGLSTDAAAGDVVLRARRVHLEDPPQPPKQVMKYVRGSIGDSALEPTLSPEAPDDLDGFDPWLDEWHAWAAVDRERRPAWHLYTFLQRAMLDLEAQPESLELVIASGLLQLSADVAGEQVRTHLITQSTLIERHAASGDLLIRLNPEAAPSLEDTQLLTGLDVFDPSGTRTLHESLATRVTSPVDPAATVFLKDWADRALTVRVDVVDRAEDAPSPDRLLTSSPALVLRKRGAYALIEYYDRMTEAAAGESSPVPLGLAQLVEAIEPADRIAWLDRSGTSSSALLAEDPLFPLPANQEQRDIIDRLTGDSGVVVEGPPGTGKTHTIANLVSALLARGQRVLVTSEKAQALRVLRDKLPSELQELCVSVTDAARGGSAELNRSVSEIATRKAQFNRRRTEQQIADVAAQRDDALSRRAKLTEQIRQVREAETYVHPEVAPGFQGTAASIVRQVQTQSSQHRWLPVPLLADTPPLTAEEFHTLLALHQRSSAERARRRRQVFPELSLPDVTDLRNACDAVAQAPGAEAGGEVPGLLRMLDGASPDTLGRIQGLCEQLRGVLRDVQQLDPRFQRAADAVLSGQAQHLWGKTAQIPQFVQAAQAADHFVGTSAVETPVTGRAAFEAYDALARKLEAGDTWRSGISRFRRSDEQSAVEAVGQLGTVDGVEATTAATARVVAEHLRVLDAVRAVGVVLGDLGIDIPIEGPRSRAVSILTQIDRDRAVVDNFVARAREVVVALQEVSPDAPRIASIDQARSVAESAHAIAAARNAEAHKNWLESVAASVRGTIAGGRSPEGEALTFALDTADFDGIRAALDAWDGAVREHQEELHLESLHTRLDNAAPALAQAIADDSTSPEWPARLTYIDRAWAWRRAEEWVRRNHARSEDGSLDRDLDAVEKDIARLTAQLAAEKAWSACLDRTTAAQVQALQTYRDHVASIGKGTGKYAERYRAGAREAMQVAQGAVPAWVMPLQQVLASIPPEQNSFDVVIVDEASQADISSLFLLWLAPRVIVVGDDKQCAPSDVSSGALDGVFSRLDSYLPDIPKYLRDSFTPRSSVFSLLRSRFGSVIRLREHFRCMPEIINWSSGQFYADAPLVPVRQFGADRLPPLRTTYVEGGVVTGKNASLTNRVEARALADALAKCLDDKAYDGKTFGVVVLQGQSQVDVIQNELLDRLTPDQWDQRRLRVGTPPDFQGDERHVVFLSMVVAPEQNIMAMTKTEYQRRFNVAASRAQDQLWLFHSRTVDSLKSTDLRHSLLTYMQSTSPAPAESMPGGVTRDERHGVFDSLFEQRVFLDIVARGYHVNPQVEANGRFIDLVVTGGAGKLAVECDGDHWHTSPDQQRADLERERELQRCGWKFWRIRESEYYLDPVGSMAGLWVELERRGITPHVVGVADVVVASDEDWAPVELVEDDSLAEDVVDLASIQVIQPDPLTVVESVTVAESIAEPAVVALQPVVEVAAVEPYEPVAALVEVPDAQSLSPVGGMIVKTLGNGSLPVVELAGRLDMDWKVVLAELDKLQFAGVVDEISVMGKRTEYRVTGVVGQPADAPSPAAAGREADDPASNPSSMLESMIVEMLGSGPVSLSDLAYRLDEPRDRVEAVMAALVSHRRVERLPERGPSVYGLVEPARPEVVERSAVESSGRVGSSIADLPPAHVDSAAEVLTAAAAIASVSVERAKKLTRLDDETVLQVLARLEREGRLSRMVDSNGTCWVRSIR
ncbi:AAA domain-containing protein [Rhodococcus sp. HNM0563]|uniref:AAA domain-containing protein n=1 Tax=Rhodococcus sp. HNM0563 TaxID=2716339 RepID=UPI003217B33A